jgi:glutamine amidotransferase
VAANLPLFAINLLLATEQGLWALRYPLTHDLYLLQREPGAALEHASSFGSRVRSEPGASRPLVVIASERMDADPGWRMLESGELVHVDHNLRVSAQRILDGPPAQPLTLEDLGARARTSQSPGAGGQDVASGR